MPPPVCRPDCITVRPGTVDYRRAWDWQVELAQAVREGRQPNTLLLLEHPPVYTLGRLSKPEHLLLTPAELAASGVELVETDRGGQITFHGPGQLVAYPVVDLKGWGGPLQYVRTLEQVIIHALADFGIAAGLNPGLTGVWVDGAKVAAIGVKISRGVAYHGFAVNVSTDLSYFQNIVPCGIVDGEVTSMEQLLGRKVDLAAVAERVGARFGDGMGLEMVECDKTLPGTATKHSAC